MTGRSEFRLGGRALAASLLGVTCGASPIPFNVLPLVMGPIHDEFGWDFAQISAGVTIYGLLAAFLAPVYGGLADRLGVRPVALWSLFAFGIVFGSFWFVPGSLIPFYLFWTVLGAVAIGSTPVTWSRAISMWFFKNRGLALGIMLLGTSIAGMIVPQLAKLAIAIAGWRFVFPAMALLPLLIALPVGLAWFREPRTDERAAGIADASGKLVGLTLRDAARGYRFWVLFVSILLIAFAYGGAHIHMAQIAQLHGLSAATAANVISMLAFGILAGRLIVGLLFDRVWAPAVAFPAMLLPALACYLLIGEADLVTVLAGAFLLGFAAGAESDIIAFLAARYFGMAFYGRIYGVLYVPFGVASALSPIAYGWSRDATGSYDLILTIAMFLFATGGALLLLMGRYPQEQEDLVSEEMALADGR